MKKIILIGGGGHCKSCIDAIESTGQYSITGIIDLPENLGKLVSGYPVIGCNNDINSLIRDNNEFLITIGSIGDPSKRTELFNLVKSQGGCLATICAATAYISKTAKLGEGTIILHQAMVNAAAVVGTNCIINSKALVEHDAVIGDNCHISTGSIVNGGTIIGENTFYGSGAVSKQYITIPANSFVKANSIVK